MEQQIDEHRIDTEQSPLIEITRVLRAPMEWVWNAWSDVDIIKQWWGPMGYTSHHAKTDFRQGGKYLFDMEDPDGKIIWTTGTYEEIIPHRRIAYTDSFSDEDGNIISSEKAGIPGAWPKKLHVTVEFEKHDDQITMKLRHEGIPKEMYDECLFGWTQMLDKFQEMVERHGDEHLKNDNRLQ